ncbi:uncharacterized protein LY79DRAFT_551099 [Colletotrichum navitas]|uniref:Uncharacterized protein n=1 Tax=Colletotrichum navitas TaxID=681940 RepID=A0AAD8V5Y1_9PEZI|nr:uncharacterized protein LY79DRAFT_551099 [Colletotrichum navitas]KAK1593853.1 hypothetical protein LY79DRAFT_551099 [Colletotrichum navitas]
MLAAYLREKGLLTRDLIDNYLFLYKFLTHLKLRLNLCRDISRNCAVAITDPPLSSQLVLTLLQPTVALGLLII